METIFKITTIGLHKYLSTTNYWMLQSALQHNAKKKAHSISKQSNKFRQELDIQDEGNETASCNIQAKEIERKSKNEGIKQLKQTWVNKLLLSRYLQRSQQDDIDYANIH